MRIFALQHLNDALARIKDFLFPGTPIHKHTTREFVQNTSERIRDTVARIC